MRRVLSENIMNKKSCEENVSKSLSFTNLQDLEKEYMIRPPTKKESQRKLIFTNEDDDEKTKYVLVNTFIANNHSL
tara:strand:- start:597 stop:824 length:228 start_codon:yes stop_codon:yes gene_type:complete